MLKIHDINELSRCIRTWPKSISSKTIFLLVVTSLQIFDKTIDKSEHSVSKLQAIASMELGMIVEILVDSKLH